MTVTISDADLGRMRANLLFDGDGAGRKLSRFWILLALAAVIASAGVVGDSTATVIGAMIVAPLMTPILGTVLSIVTGDRPNLFRSLLLVAGGSLLAIGIGFAFGWLTPVHVVASTSSQVASRVHPRIIDLLAALATGAVGAFAQCRDDVSDTLPGVAIAISLVPPLTVVGLTLEAGATRESAGALLLFLTNVAAILLSGVVVMALYRVHRHAIGTEGTGLHRANAVALVVALVLIVAVPLAATSVSVARTTIREADVARISRGWAEQSGWSVVGISHGAEAITVVAMGALPAPDPAALRAALDGAGLRSTEVRLRLVPEQQVVLPGK